MKTRASIGSRLKELGISKVRFNFSKESEGPKIGSAGYDQDLAFAQALFPEKKFSTREQKLLSKIVEGFYYVKGSEPYKKNLGLIAKFPEIGKIAKAAEKAENIVKASTRRNLSIAEKEIWDKLMSNSFAKSKAQVLEVQELWHFAQGNGKRAESCMKKLKEIFNDPKRKEEFIADLTFEKIVFSAIEASLQES